MRGFRGAGAWVLEPPGKSQVAIGFLTNTGMDIVGPSSAANGMRIPLAGR